MSVPHKITQSNIKCRIRAYSEDTPGNQWAALFQEFWPYYKNWFLLEGALKRPTYRDGLRMLKFYMPNLLPVYEELVELAGGSDYQARFLSLYKPAPYLAGCSQVVWTGDEPALIRNYDYHPDLWEGVILKSKWKGRRVIGVSDCAWGLLDGINEDGLVVSLTFGGRKVVGDGFGVPLVLRHALESCTNVEEARAVFERIPIHMAYNVAMVDSDGEYVTAYLSPDRDPVFRYWPISTNHQDLVDWPEYTAATGSVEREKLLASCLGNPAETVQTLSERFLYPPLYQTRYSQSYGTLYSAIYYPCRGTVEYRWPNQKLIQSFDHFQKYDQTIIFHDAK